MGSLIDKYATKLATAGLVEPGAALLGFLDADLVWNRPDPACVTLEKVFDRLSINSLLFASPREPYRTILNALTRKHASAIYPNDCETRTFLHDLPIIPAFEADTIVGALQHRRCAIIRDRGIVAFGTVTPEQAYIAFSSVCFTTFVKFFFDHRIAVRQGTATAEDHADFDRVIAHLAPPPTGPAVLRKGPFDDGAQAMAALVEAGEKTVSYGLVDSFFGNISYRVGSRIFISQTSSSLDELAGAIDPCPLDGTSCAGITASSELSAHRQILVESDNRAVLHGHPRFSVIMSMDCSIPDCTRRGECHRRCPHDRQIIGIPIVPGEVGMGPFGLCNTVPRAMKNHPAVIVYGHGVFTVGQHDFNDAFARLLAAENGCREEYFRQVRRPGS
jgi:ribulose-5-phosphate 4-epimerase/fuculose-1-phosphate aldolase